MSLIIIQSDPWDSSLQWLEATLGTGELGGHMVWILCPGCLSRLSQRVSGKSGVYQTCLQSVSGKRVGASVAEPRRCQQACYRGLFYVCYRIPGSLDLQSTRWLLGITYFPMLYINHFSISELQVPNRPFLCWHSQPLLPSHLMQVPMQEQMQRSIREVLGSHRRTTCHCESWVFTWIQCPSLAAIFSVSPPGALLHSKAEGPAQICISVRTNALEATWGAQANILVGWSACLLGRPFPLTSRFREDFETPSVIGEIIMLL